jgi:hypothetical protein
MSCHRTKLLLLPPPAATAGAAAVVLPLPAPAAVLPLPAPAAVLPLSRREFVEAELLMPPLGLLACTKKQCILIIVSMYFHKVNPTSIAMQNASQAIDNDHTARRLIIHHTVLRRVHQMVLSVLIYGCN